MKFLFRCPPSWNPELFLYLSQFHWNEVLFFFYCHVAKVSSSWPTTENFCQRLFRLSPNNDPHENALPQTLLCVFWVYFTEICIFFIRSDSDRPVNESFQVLRILFVDCDTYSNTFATLPKAYCGKRWDLLWHRSHTNSDPQMKIFWRTFVNYSSQH